MNLMTKRIEALEAAAAKHYNGVATKVVRSQSEIEAIARAGLTERFAEADAVFAAYPNPVGVEPYVANAEELRRFFRKSALAGRRFATGDPDREAPAERSNPIAPCSEGADAQNSGVSGEGAQDITDHYPNPKGAKRWATKRSPAKRLAHFG